jgi:hypothetical protein
MSAMEVQHYLSRAQDFMEGMLLLREDEQFQSSSALLGIHAAVSYTDALRIGLGDESLVSEDHRTAAAALRKLILNKRESNVDGVTRFEKLVAKKSLIAYGNKRLDRNDFESVYTNAERFAKWANDMGSQLKIEGWKYGDQ